MEEASRRAEASRRNGSRGGVKTAEGKAITRLNAQRHGFFSRHLVLRNQWVKERQTDFDRLLAELQADREPVGVEEHLVIRQLAVAYWKLMTLQGAETKLLERQLAEANQEISSNLDPIEKEIQELKHLSRFCGHSRSCAVSVEEGAMTIEDYESACKVNLLGDLKFIKGFIARGGTLNGYIGEKLRADISNASPSDKVNAVKLAKEWLEAFAAFTNDRALKFRNERRVLVKQLEPFLDLALFPAGSNGERLLYYKDRLRKQTHRWHLRLYALQNARLNKAEHRCPEAKVMYISSPDNSAEGEKEKEG